MTDDLRELLARHLPGYQARSVAKLGEGWDDVVHEVNGELVVRRSRDADPARRSATTRREVELLEAVAELPSLPVPEPVSADRKLPGESLFDHPVADLAPVAAALAFCHNDLGSEHVLVEDLTYGFRTGQRRYADAGLAHLPWTSAPGH